MQYPKRSKTAAEIDAVQQEIEALQAETEQAVQQYEVTTVRLNSEKSMLLKMLMMACHIASKHVDQ